MPGISTSAAIKCVLTLLMYVMQTMTVLTGLMRTSAVR